MKEITVLAPATVANVVCGFDCLGFAIENPCDQMTLRLIDEKTIKIRHLDNFDLPIEPEKNIAGVALLAVLEEIEENIGFEVEITKNIKPGSGIGSSSASAVGAVFAANKLLGDRFSPFELAEFAMKGEQVASKGRHADNVAPCLFGGFTLVRSVEPLDIVALDFPEIFVTVIHPQIEIKTSEARKILPAEISLKSAVQAWSNVGALVSALSKGDYGLISRSLEDFIVEPVRKKLIPHFDALKSESLKAGALGGGISGSGPSVFMLSENIETANDVEKSMREIYAETEIDFNVYVSKINSKGVKILK
ncbi:MAG TPA: homoserine kinase [Pyrinomonadaceae bacterium]|jgi:homoserine kinase|nr:homoserine kinase [Pyrinomonadaceae bacterium]